MSVLFDISTGKVLSYYFFLITGYSAVEPVSARVKRGRPLFGIYGYSCRNLLPFFASILPNGYLIII